MCTVDCLRRKGSVCLWVSRPPALGLVARQLSGQPPVGSRLGWSPASSWIGRPPALQLADRQFSGGRPSRREGGDTLQSLGWSPASVRPFVHGWVLPSWVRALERPSVCPRVPSGSTVV